ncbi:MAG: AAA family ATPase [Porphyromonadaceae bacterium]|nr:AAA family ATPase [Porphyromonadaceae bacterium]
MKILKLKFKNINSLVGENEIDFSDPVFKDDGLFAITGKTGSGKSSILDAISLALFGKTPRVDSFTKENAVLTRGEKDCYAEIVFEVAGKKWKSSWKQELNRNGNLKPVNRQIADFDDKIIADQISKCNEEIVKILGLTFEQFTKVILLAQGSFAAFLQADKNLKGELLEQITGTEIYGDISKEVFKRNSAEKAKLEAISLELEAIKILSDTEIEQLTAEITETKLQKEQIDGELLQVETAKKWLDDIGSLQKQIQENKQKTPELEEKLKEDIEKFEAIAEKLKTANAEQEKYQPIFTKVRGLDSQIADRKKDLQPVLLKISELNGLVSDISTKIENKNNELGNAVILLKERQAWSAENSIYEELITGFSAIETENLHLEKSANEIQSISQVIEGLTEDLESKNSALAASNKLFLEKENELNHNTIILETKRADQNQILNGTELTHLHDERDSIREFGIRLRDFIKNETEISVHQSELKNHNERLLQIEDAKIQLSEVVEKGSSTQSEVKSKISLLEENIKLAQTIRDLDEHRRHLKDGEKCPLCGSLEHPFAIGNVPQMGNKEVELTNLQKQNDDITKNIQKTEKELVSLETEKNGLLRNKDKEQNLLNEKAAKQADLLATIRQTYPDFIIPDKENRIENLEKILTEKRRDLKRINAQIEKAGIIEKEIQNLRDKIIPGIQKEKSTAETQKNEAEKAQILAQQKLRDQQKSLDELIEKFNTEKDSFLSKLKRYAVADIQSLRKCLADWNENVKETENLIAAISDLKNAIKLDAQQLENLRDNRTKSLKEKEDRELELKELSTLRNEIFGEKSVEVEESNLKILISETEKSKENAEKSRNESKTELEKIKAIIKDRETDLLKKQEQKITEKTIEELEPEIDRLKSTSESLSQKIGANKQTLILNAENLKRSGSKLKEKEKQQEVYNKWGRLNSLIGSADGKSYRNFAQALTFEHLIGLANKQLQKMSNRYMLKRTEDNANPFDLSVIDNFQNSELRTAQNLSGGEKFIVSLSLALGLASMASKNMRIDTMFIDEGFGTLDSDYLDLALNALSNLQSEGKIIGVISHLTELKERIATHMEVIPIGNGHSKIQLTY